MNIVLVSLFHYDNYGLRLLFSNLRAHDIPVYYVGFKRLRQKTTKTLKNDYVEWHDYHTEVTRADMDALLDRVEGLNPALVGISLQSIHFQIARRITEEIKAKLNVPVVWGGSHPTLEPERCIQHTDMVCVGEGFDALVEVSRRILRNEPYDDIRNIWVNKGGAIIKNATRPLIDNLDVLPYASFDGKNKIYIDEGRRQTDRIIDYFGFGFTDEPLKSWHQTMTSLGCPMKCSFCLHGLRYDTFRRRSVPHVIQELSEAKEKNPYLKMVIFWDNIFAVNRKWCLEFAEEYKEKINLPFFAYSHPSFVDMDILTALRGAGWSVTIMGIQSGSYDLRKNVYGRNETDAQVLEAARRIDRMKKTKGTRKYFRLFYDYLKNNPLEDEEKLSESLHLMLQFPKGFIYQAFNLSFFPNYVITRDYLEKGIISAKDVEGETRTSATNWITTFDTGKEYEGNLKTHEYYYLLFSLAQFGIFPNFLIKRIERKKLFYNHLRVLYRICGIVRIIELIIRPSNYSWLWELMRSVPLRLKIKYRTVMRFE